MGKTSILEKEDYTQLFYYIYKNPKVWASKLTKDLSKEYVNRRNFAMKIQELKKKDFIISEDYGRYAKYSINKIGVLNYWIENYLPEHITLIFKGNLRKLKEKELTKTINAFLDALFLQISLNTTKSDEALELKHNSLKDAFEDLRDNLLLDGLLYFKKNKKLKSKI